MTLEQLAEFADANSAVLTAAGLVVAAVIAGVSFGPAVGVAVPRSGSRPQRTSPPWR